MLSVDKARNESWSTHEDWQTHSNSPIFAGSCGWVLSHSWNSFNSLSYLTNNDSVIFRVSLKTSWTLNGIWTKRNFEFVSSTRFVSLHTKTFNIMIVNEILWIQIDRKLARRWQSVWWCKQIVFYFMLYNLNRLRDKQKLTDSETVGIIRLSHIFTMRIITTAIEHHREFVRKNHKIIKTNLLCNDDDDDVVVGWYIYWCRLRWNSVDVCLFIYSSVQFFFFLNRRVSRSKIIIRSFSHHEWTLKRAQ